MPLADHSALNLRPLTHVEAVVLTNRYPDAFIELAKVAAGLQSRDPFDQARVLMTFAIENMSLLNDVVAFGSDQHANRAAVEALAIDSKLLAIGQILALTGARMQAEEDHLADIPAPSVAVH